MTKLVEMKNISKSFFGVEVLRDVNFDIEAGEVVALCGENGAGKSTLMKILSAVYSHDSGEILLEGKPVSKHIGTLDMQHMGVSMIHQELNLMEHLTVAQNIFLTREPLKKSGLIDYKKMNAEAKRLLESLGQDIDPTEHTRNLKIAQKQMVEIAKGISFNVKVMIMDEPTATLTNRETEILFDLIRDLAKKGLGVIYISHRLKEIKQVCTRVTVLRDGQFVGTKKIEDATEQDIANMMVGREVTIKHPEPFTGSKDQCVLEVNHVTDSFLKDVSFRVFPGEIVGFSGLVGAGRSELMEFVFGIRKVDQGEVLVHGKKVEIHSPQDAIKHGIGFATEDRQATGVFLIHSIRANINLIKQLKDKGFYNHAQQFKSNTQKMIDRLRIKCSSQLQMAGNLSGGNQQKVVLGKWLLAEPDILILDEPTRGIDVGAREEIYQIIQDLANQGKSIIIVSSDLTEVLSICQRVIIMHEGCIKAELESSECSEEVIMQFATNAS